MQKSRFVSIIILVICACVLIPVLAGCSNLSSEPVRVVKDYIRALSAQDQNAVSNLTCKEWETQAFLELDALQLVKASVSNLNCREAETVSGGVIVECTGAIETTYNNETSQIDLSQNRYFVSHENGDWLACGYR
jgi:maltodextrin utilization protein YvdJ